jgi:uncharacterized protein YceK
MRILIAIMVCFVLAGCQSVPLKNGELYVNQNTSLGMGNFGVAKVRNQF